MVVWYHGGEAKRKFVLIQLSIDIKAKTSTLKPPYSYNNFSLTFSLDIFQDELQYQRSSSDQCVTKYNIGADANTFRVSWNHRGAEIVSARVSEVKCIIRKSYWCFNMLVWTP